MLCYCSVGFSQHKFRVYFADKGVADSDTAFTDRAVHHPYLIQTLALADSSRPASRWFNMVAIFTDSLRIQKIQVLPFVKNVEFIPKVDFTETPLCTAKFDSILKSDESLLLYKQTQIMGANYFADKGFDGTGITVCIIDAGFKGTDTSPAFRHIRQRKGILDTYNFIKTKPDVYNVNESHGTMVLSCIGGRINNRPMGLASGANFLLAITEQNLRDGYIEEEYWLAAAEWAHSKGAKIINSSLGYTSRMYYKEDMDGKTTLVTRAAAMAARKGILVVNSAGNEGNGRWGIIAAPADADSVLTVGGIDALAGFATNFSSFGPSYSFKLKPNVCAPGFAITSTGKGLQESAGTSFSSPLVAGFAACAMQAKPTLNNMAIFDAIEKSGSLYPYYDYAHGYGVPQASKFLADSIVTVAATFEVKNEAGVISVFLRPDIFKLDAKDDEKVLFYHVMAPNGLLEKYFVIETESMNPLNIPINELYKGNVLRIHYKGYTYIYTHSN